MLALRQLNTAVINELVALRFFIQASSTAHELSSSDSLGSITIYEDRNEEFLPLLVVLGPDVPVTVWVLELDSSEFLLYEFGALKREQIQTSFRRHTSARFLSIVRAPF